MENNNQIELFCGIPMDFVTNYLRDSGTEPNEFFNLFKSNSYEEYKELTLKSLQKEFLNIEDDSEMYRVDKSFSSITDFDIDEGMYKEMKDEMHALITEMENLYKITSKKRKKYRFPFEKILNGNYEKIRVDKSSLSYEQKVQLNVHGLPDDMYDVIMDKDNGKLVSIYYDKSTVNEQWYIFTIFLEKLFKKRGIKGNHLTPLILLDRDLLGVDTDKVNDPVMMSKVMVEGRRNPFYHFREVARNQPKDDGEPTRYFINIATYTYIWLYSQNKNTFREQGRQTGKTYDMGHGSSYEFSYGSDKTNIGAFHFIYTKATENRKEWIGYANLYPQYLQVHNIISKTTRGKTSEIVAPEPMSPGNGKNIENKKFSNKFTAIAIGTSKMAAEQAGRGSTLRFIFGDELNFIKYIKTAFTALMFAHATARKIAVENGYRTGMHFASTSGTLDSEQGRMMYKFIFEDMVKFDPVLFELDYDDLTSYINKRSKNRFVYIGYSYKDLGYDEDWLDESIAGKSPEEVRTDMLCHWLSTASGALFPTDSMGRIDALVNKANFHTWLFNKLNIIRLHNYTSFDDLIREVKVLSIGIDIAYGDMSDYTSLTAVDLITGERLFDFEDNNMDTVDAAIFIKALVKHIISIKPDIKMIINPEIDGPGRASIIPNLKRDPVVERYLFRSTVYTNKELSEPVIKSVSYSIDEKTMVEYGTSMRRKRGILFNVMLFEMVDKYPRMLIDSQTSNELKTLIKNKTGKILAKSGFHDDKICSTLHAYSPLFLDDYREALVNFFGIHVSLANIEADPLTSKVYNLRDEENSIEGRVFWKVLDHTDEYGQFYQTINVFKIINGCKIKLTHDEIEEERYINDDLNRVMSTMRGKFIHLTHHFNNSNRKNNNLIESNNSNNRNSRLTSMRMSSGIKKRMGIKSLI